MPRFSAVLFDLDGTLLDTLTDLSNAVNDALLKLGHPTHTKEVVCTFIGNGLKNLMMRALPEGKKESELSQAMAYFSSYYEAHHSDYTMPYDGIETMIDTLHQAGIKMAVVSNKDDGFVRTLTKRFFAPAILESVGRKPEVAIKPDPTMALTAAEAIGALPEETLFVGDSLVDWQTAINTGMTGACVTWGFHTHEALAQKGVETLFDTPEALTHFIMG